MRSDVLFLETRGVVGVEVVKDGDVPTPFSDQRVDQVAADETCPPGDECALQCSATVQRRLDEAKPESVRWAAVVSFARQDPFAAHLLTTAAKHPRCSYGTDILAKAAAPSRFLCERSNPRNAWMAQRAL